MSDLAPLTYVFGLEGRDPKCEAMKTSEKANRPRLFTLAKEAGQPLLREHIEVLLTELRDWVKAAGHAKWIPEKAG